MAGTLVGAPATGLDARVIMSRVRAKAAMLPAWRQMLRRHHQLPDGTRVYLRPLMAADLRHAEEFFARLSERSRYQRFMAATRAPSSDFLRLLERHSRQPRSAVVVAFVRHANGTEIIGGARLVATSRPGTCEFAVTIVDAWQRRGVGRVLLREVVDQARALGYSRIEGFVLANNAGMLAVARHLGLRVCERRGDRDAVVVWRRLWPSVGGIDRRGRLPVRESARPFR